MSEKYDVLKMEAGKELRELVAIEVMEWTRPRFDIDKKLIPPCPVRGGDFDYFNPPEIVEVWRSDYFWRKPNGSCHTKLPDYPNDISAAFEVVEKLKDDCLTLTYLSKIGGKEMEWEAMFRIKGVAAWADTIPLAICRVAVLDVMKDKIV